MKIRFTHLILSIILGTQVAGLFIKPSYMRSSSLLGTSDRRRQVGQPPQPTLPSNYWWPFASSASGSAAATPVPVTTVMPLLIPPSMVVPVSSSTIPSDFTSSTLALSTSTPDTLSLPATSTLSSSSTSDSSTAIRNPQQTDSGSHFHAPRLLIPIIASIGGTIVGILVLALLLCRWCTRRRREYTMRRSSRRQRDRRDAEKGWRRVSIDNWEDQRTTLHQQRQQKRSWWNKLFWTRSEVVEDVVPGPRYVGVDDDVERPILGRAGNGGGQLQHEPLLAVKTRRSIRTTTGERRPLNHSLLAGPLMPSRSTSTAPVYNDESEEDDCEGSFKPDDKEQEVPWESLRHKSIKRAIIAKVDEEKKWTDSIRGVRAANAQAAKVGRRQTHVRCDSDFWISSASSSSDAKDTKDGGGFRIVPESPPQIPTPPSKTWMSLASSFPFFSRMGSSSSGADEDELGAGRVEDRYTPAPARMRSGSKSRSRGGSITSPVRKIQAQDRSRPMTSSASAAAVQVLLKSPPTVMSPEMESALCFTPVLPASKSNWMMNGLAADIGERLGRDPGLGHNSHRPIENSAMESAGTAFTKTYRLRTDRALKRVEAIVESGWTERGVARVAES